MTAPPGPPPPPRPAPHPSHRASLSTTVDVETPELVVLSYTVAGPGSRTAAALIDYLICIGVLVLLVIGLAQFDGPRIGSRGNARSGVWITAVLSILQWAALWLYYVLFEAFSDGQTPGKRIMGLRVVRDGGLAITVGASAVRNLVRIVDMQPIVMYAVGFISMVANRQGKRLGDIAAGTLVVREDAVKQPMALAGRTTDRGGRSAAAPAPVAPTLAAELSEAEYEVLDRFAARYSELDAARRAALADALAARFAEPLARVPGPSVASRLINLHDIERRARAGGAAARTDTGAARERYAIVAANAGRWASFAQRVTRAQSEGGLRALPEAQVREFVQEYREVAADLARLRTATRGRSADEVFYLNRLVASAHSLLYRRRSVPVRTVLEFLFGDVPREIRRSWRPILLASLLLFGPMAIAGRATFTNPAIAERLLPATMLDRAEEGVARAKQGTGYIPDPDLYRPLMATSVITNNIQVAFFAFALGVTAGAMTLWILLMNGVSIGAAFGLYASKGIGTLLLAFVAPHGVLELFAIVVAGGAGFLLGAGILLPGERTRGAALVANGARAIRLVAGSALLLLVAGALEGFVSPIATWPLSWKLAVSGASAIVLALYLLGGSRRTRRAPDDLPPTGLRAP